MKYSVMAYFDKDLNKFNPPMVIPFNVEDAVDSIKDGVKKGSIPGAKSFDLYHLGSFDTANAKFEISEKPVLKAVLSDYVRETK